MIDKLEQSILKEGKIRVEEKIVTSIKKELMPKIEGNATKLIQAEVERSVRESLVAAFKAVENTQVKSAGSLPLKYAEAIEKTYEEGNYFVIAASSVKRSDVENELERVKGRNGIQVFTKAFPKAEVMAPYSETNHYPLVLGSALPYKEANKLREKAIKYGFRSDTYLWKSKGL